MVALVGMISGLAALPLVPSLNPEARPWLAVSALVHNLYYIFLQRAYAHGDLSQAYPLARGLAPIIVMVLSAAVAQEFLHKVIGVALVSCGVITLASASGTGRSMLKASGYAMATGLLIGAYTVFDGMGVRASVDPLTYIAWLNIAKGPWAIAAFVILTPWRNIAGHLARSGPRGLVGGIVSVAAYGIVMWALGHAPMAQVATLRETSVLFASLMGVFVLGEPLGRIRLLAAVLIVCGLAIMQLRL